MTGTLPEGARCLVLCVHPPAESGGPGAAGPRAAALGEGTVDALLLPPGARATGWVRLSPEDARRVHRVEPRRSHA